jgi:predicted nuclease of predicted toxin-antitoxin system
VLDQGLGGKSDLDVASVCHNEALTLVTLDTDFGDIRAYPP